MLRVALKGVFANKLRLTLTALAIVIGVAFVAASYVFTDTISASFRTLLSNINVGVDVVVRPVEADFGDEQLAMPEAVLADVLAIDGVAVAEGSVDSITIQVIGKDGEPIGGQGPPTVGVSWGEVESMNPTTLQEGRAPTGPGEVALDVDTAETGGYVIGDQALIVSAQPSEAFEVVGLVSFGEDNALLGATLAIFELDTARRLMGFEGQYTMISVQATPGVDPEVLAAQVGTALPPGVEAITAEAQNEQDLADIEEGLGFLNTALLAFAAVAVFVGAFIISNTFRIIVAQRTRELALLRAVGATGRQIIWMVLIEAIAVALVASVIGVAIGVVLALGIGQLMSAVGFSIPTGGLTLLPRTVIVAMLVGLIVTALSALLPARRAARVPPVAAMREEAARPKRRSLRNRSLVGIGVTAVGLIALVVGLFADIANAIAYVGLGALLFFLGVSILAPLAARPVAAVLGWPLPRIYGVTGQLSQENTKRQPRRTAATASALMIGVALVVFVAVFAESIKDTVEDSIFDAFPADLSASSTNFIVGVSPAFTDELRALDELETVSGVKFGQIRVDSEDQVLIGVDPASIDEVYSIDASPGALGGLTEESVLLHVDELERKQLSVGETVSLEYALTGPQTVTIVGTFAGDDFGNNYATSETAYLANFSNEFDGIVFAIIAPGVSFEEGRAAMDAVATAYPNVEVQSKSEVVADAEDQINQLLNLFTGLLFLAVLIAVLGIANTLALSIIERTREIGLLRAVGMLRRQVRRMVRWEAVIIALFGGVLGTAIGVFLGWAVVVALEEEGLSTFGIPWSQLAIYLVVAGFAGALAAIFPSYKASNLDILDAIAYE